MLNLFLTDFRRLIKDKVFYIGLVILAFYGFWGVRTTSCFDLDKCISIDGSSMIVTIPAMIILFVIFFTSLFIGTDYNEGTIRNKLIVGKKRSYIYLSNLIITFIVATIYFLTYYLSIRLGLHHYKYTLDIDKNLLKYLMFDGYLVTLAFNSLTVLIGMLYTNKVGSLLSNIISYGVLLLMGGNIIFSFMGSKYAESKPLRMLIEMLPNVQVGLMFGDAYKAIVNYKIIWLGSLFFIVLINAIGMLIFEVKDLK